MASTPQTKSQFLILQIQLFAVNSDPMEFGGYNILEARPSVWTQFWKSQSLKNSSLFLAVQICKIFL